MTDKIFIDTDIILDLILARDPFIVYANELFTLIEDNKVIGHVSSLTFSNLFYILRKYESSRTAIKLLTRLRSLVHILHVDERIIDLSLSSDFKDFEDAIQYYTALESDIQYLLTRNKKDYSESDIIICSAKEYLSIRVSKEL